MILALDHDLDSFNSWLDQTIGLSNVWMALTADHGVAPVAGEAAKLGVHAVAVNMDKVYEQLNADLDKRFAHVANTSSFLLPNPDLPYVTLDRRKFEKAALDEKAAEDAVAALLPAAVAAQIPNPPPVLKVLHPQSA